MCGVRPKEARRSSLPRSGDKVGTLIRKDANADGIRTRNEAAVADAAKTRPATYIAFDVLLVVERNVRNETLEHRIAELQRIVPASTRIRPLLPIELDGEWRYQQAERLEMKGIVAKRAGSRYTAGRTRDWLKIKTPCGVEVESDGLIADRPEVDQEVEYPFVARQRPSLDSRFATKNCPMGRGAKVTTSGP